MSKIKFRETLLASTIIAGMLVATPAFAQDAPPEGAPPSDETPPAGLQTQESAGPAEENSQGDIVVTGTLIKNPNLTSSSPVAVIGQEEMQLRQSNVAEELLRDLPGAVPSIGSAVNNGNGGAAFADLRGLGNFRNLVLLDGQRITPSSTIGRVDLNNIPLALVDRVDTLTGGAATTYGADAVSGVINFITRRDFAGMELSASEQITQRGDGNVFRTDLTLGANFDDGRGNAVLSLGYQESDPVYQGARKFSLNNYTSTTGAVGGSGTTVPARFSRPGATGGFDQINPVTGALVNPVTNFNFNPYNIFQTPFQRFNIFGAAHYEVADNIEVYTRGMFSKNRVNTIIAPSGVFSSLLVIPVSNPFLPAAARATFCANNDFDFTTPGIQPITPAQCAAAATALTPADPNFRAFSTTVGRRTTELGPRLSEFQTTMFDYRAGVRLGITDSIDLDVSGAYGESQNEQNQQNYVLTSRIRTAVYTSSTTSCNLGASPTVNNPNPALPPLAQPGASPSAGTGCVPVNIFGAAGSISPEMIPYLTADAGTQQRASLAQARALLSGDFGASAPWAEDPIGFALGAEYRKYTGEQRADVLSQSAGELGGAGGAVLNFNGGYDVKEVYGEIIAPIVQDRPFFNALTLEAGIRFSDYKVDAPGTPSYSTTTWKAAATWEPFDGLKFRGNYQRAVRAPNINELFAPTAVGLTSLGVDPCRTTRNAAGVITYGPALNANLRAVCLAQGAPLSAINNITNPTAAQSNGTFAGSLALRPETADSYTVGLVFQPEFVRGLSITVDYYHIRIKDAISQPTGGDLIQNCFGGNNAPGVTATSATDPNCLLFRRDPVLGTLSGDTATTGGMVFPVSNSGFILTDGIDVGVNFRRDLGFAKLNWSFQGNWTNRSLFQATVAGSVIPPGFPGAGGSVPASAVRECVGFYSTNCGSPGSAGPNSAPGSLQPEFSWNQRTTLTFGDIDLSLLWRHISKMEAEAGVVAFAGTLPGRPTAIVGVLDGTQVDFGHIKARDYFDFAVRFGVSENFDLTMTVMNLLDKDPPIVGSTIGSTSFNSGNTYPSTYDALGRRFAIGGRLKF
ncbi:MAG: iron complex outerrane recepter protein [Sphingomonadales bacterium]|jgi:outer membrane receptor protein involved in Fe transport|nr:iron complex outerrane recepter protein [Sphingomonadales bacterium]